jgi:hypothetical protein
MQELLTLYFLRGYYIPDVIAPAVHQLQRTPAVHVYIFRYYSHRLRVNCVFYCTRLIDCIFVMD